MVGLEFRSIGFGREPTTNQHVLTAFRKEERDVFFPMFPREMCKFYTRKAVHAFIIFHKKKNENRLIRLRASQEVVESYRSQFMSFT